MRRWSFTAGKAVRIVASIEDRLVIKKSLIT